MQIDIERKELGQYYPSDIKDFRFSSVCSFITPFCNSFEVCRCFTQIQLEKEEIPYMLHVGTVQATKKKKKTIAINYGYVLLNIDSFSHVVTFKTGTDELCDITALSSKTCRYEQPYQV